MDAERLAQTMELARQVIEDPTSNLTATVFLLSIVGIIALIAIIVLALVVYLIPMARLAATSAETSSSDTWAEVGSGSARGADPSRRARAKRGSVATYNILLWAILAGIVAATYFGSGTDQYCAALCHRGSNAVLGWEKATHPGTHCIDCHEGPAASPLENVATRVECLVRYADGPRPGSRPVSDARCVSCHDDTLSSVVTFEARGLRVDHRGPVNQGVPCRECHGPVGHASSDVPAMSVCIRCHDGDRLSGECATCHLGDPAKASLQDRVFPKIVAANRDCGACHDQTACDACHGTRMPHSEEFKAYMHARDAVFERKEMCWKCHDMSLCGKCHAPFDTGHGTNLAETKSNHFRETRSARQNPRTGCSCHTNSEIDNFCALCHDDAAPLFIQESASTPSP